VVSDKTAATPDPVDCPVGTLLPNSNPGFAGLLLHRAEDGKDGGYPLGDITFAAPGSTLMLRPALVSGAREDYLYVNSDGDTECRQELPFFAWMTNGGTFDGDYTFVAEEGDLDEIAGREKVNHLTLPDRESMADGVDLWVVARDRRGGLTWLKRRFLPQDE
jgi:hypothetical protein